MEEDRLVGYEVQHRHERDAERNGCSVCGATNSDTALAIGYPVIGGRLVAVCQFCKEAKPFRQMLSGRAAKDLSAFLTKTIAQVAKVNVELPWYQWLPYLVELDGTTVRMETWQRQTIVHSYVGSDAVVRLQDARPAWEWLNQNSNGAYAHLFDFDSCFPLRDNNHRADYIDRLQLIRVTTERS